MGQQFLIVDGHSVIFAWPDLRAMHEKRTAAARERLIKILTEYHDFTGVNVVLVFDGKGSMISEESERGGIQVFYSDNARTADDIIERLVAKYAKIHSILVATSDLLEQQTAITFGAQCVSADGLRDLLEETHRSLERELIRRKKKP
jgi:uncharacterized protein